MADLAVVEPDSNVTLPEDDNGEEYFATLPAEEIGQELMNRVDEFYKYSDETGAFKRALKSYNCYFGMAFNSVDGDSTQISAAGPSDAYMKIRVNHYRNIGKHQQNLVTVEKPAMKPIATNTSHNAIAQALLCGGILEYYARKLEMERLYALAVELAIISGESYVRLDWDPHAGDTVGNVPLLGADGAPTVDGDGRSVLVEGKNGDLVARVHAMPDVIRDPYLDRPEDANWHIVCTYKSKWDLAAKYPEYRDEILALETKDSSRGRYRFSQTGYQTDQVPVYEFLHKRTPAVPEGRQVVFLSKEVVLYADDLPYQEYPLYRLAASELVGTPFGYTVMYDLLGIQEAIDQLYSIVITNQKTFGHQNILIPEGANISLETLEGGLNVLKYIPQQGAKPEGLNLVQTPAEIFAFIKQLETVMEVLSGVNSTVRGQPQANLESGTALALVQSQAQGFVNDLTRGFKNLIGKVGTGMVKLIREMATTSHKAAICGKTQQYALIEFQGRDLEGIDAVQVEDVSAYSQTTAGKMDMAEKLLMSGLLTKADQFIQLVNSGRLEVMSEAEMKQALLVRRENEWLQDGKQVPEAALTDNHVYHIQEHACVIADPDIRLSKPKILQRTLEHMKSHVFRLASQDPLDQQLLIAMGQQPLMPQGMGPPGGPGMLPPGAPPGPPGPKPEPPGVPKTKGGPPGVAAPAKPPKQPATGQPWNPVNGGGVVQS